MQNLADKMRKNKVAKFLLSKDSATFSFFILIACILWIMHSTSIHREIKTSIPVKYIGTPENIIFNDPLPNTLQLSIRDEGFELWKYFTTDLDTLVIDLSTHINSKASSFIEIPADQLIPRIKSRIATSTQISGIHPSSIKSHYTSLHSRSIPFRLSTTPNIAQHHVLLDSIEISPTHATIYGNPSAIDSISHITLNTNNQTINKSGTYSFPLSTPKDIHKISPNNPLTHINIEMSSEKHLSIPVKFSNTPTNTSIICFPSNINVTFSVGVSQFNNISEKDFEILLDYNNSTPDGRAKIQFSKTPQNIHNLKFQPTEIEFLINTTQTPN